LSLLGNTLTIVAKRAPLPMGKHTQLPLHEKCETNILSVLEDIISVLISNSHLLIVDRISIYV
jgi:hypothetical protein